MQSTPNIVSRVTRPSSLNCWSSPLTTTGGVRPISRNEMTCPESSAGSSVPITAITAPRTATAHTATVSRTTQGWARAVMTAAVRVTAWSTTVTSRAPSPSAAASWKVRSSRISPRRTS